MPPVKDLRLVARIIDRDLLSADDELCTMTVPLGEHFAVATSGEMRDLWLEPGASTHFLLHTTA